MLNEILKKRNIPPLKNREEMLQILQQEIYGYIPPKPEGLSWEVQKDYIPNFCAGKATLDRVILSAQMPLGTFKFPIYVAIPTTDKKHPFFVNINFRDNIPDRYLPSEEIVDNGFAVISFCYKDVTDDNDDFTDGLAGVVYKDGKRDSTSAGKIAMWAWAAQRAMDFADTLDCLDGDFSIVCGHSRLGKTALLAAATDERFRFAFSNNSGCSGAAITRGKQGERVADICKNFPYWFCKNYYKYAQNEQEMPFDQHFLLSSIAPRYVYVASAQEDLWADPQSEFLCCVAASKAYEQLGHKGFVCDDILPHAPVCYHDGNIGYHLRGGSHYFSREDWKLFINYFNRFYKQN